MTYPPNYIAQVPADGSVKPEVQEFISHFFSIEDTEDHELYAQQFTEDATMIIEPNSVKGRKGIIEQHARMWASVVRRQHYVENIYAYGQDSTRVMLHGTCSYWMSNGKEMSAPWAARGHLQIGEDGDVKFVFYQVYVNSGTFTRVS